MTIENFSGNNIIKCCFDSKFYITYLDINILKLNNKTKLTFYRVLGFFPVNLIKFFNDKISHKNYLNILF